MEQEVVLYMWRYTPGLDILRNCLHLVISIHPSVHPNPSLILW